MTRGHGKLCGTTKPNNDHVWNDFKRIEDLAGSLESQIDDQQTALIHRMYKHEGIIRDEKDDNE